MKKSIFSKVCGHRLSRTKQQTYSVVHLSETTLKALGKWCLHPNTPAVEIMLDEGNGNNFSKLVIML